MQRFYDRLDRVLTLVLQILVVAMVLSISAEIVLNAIVQPAVSYWLASLAAGQASALKNTLQGLNHLLANASSPVNTASQTLLIWIGIFGSSLAFRTRSHMGVDALVRLYPPKARLVLDYLSTALVGLFSLCILLFGGYLVCYRAFSLGSKMPGFEFLNQGWFYLVLVITGALNLLYCIYHFLHPKPVQGWAGNEKESTLHDA